MRIKVLVISDYREFVSPRPEAELFIGLQTAGLDITIMTYPDAAWTPYFKKAGIRVIESHPVKKFHKPSIKMIRKELEKGGYHILHLFNSKASSNGIPAAKKLSVKVLLYRGYAGNVHWYDPAQYLKYLHPRVDKIWCITNEIEETIRKNSLLVKHKGVTILKGHDPQWYSHVQPVSSLEQYRIPADAFTVICMANVRPMKGIPYLLKATHHLAPGLPIHFLFAGKGFDKKHIQELISSSPYKNNIHCIGYVEEPLLLVAASQVFVLPSIKGEGLSKSTMEAMSLGIPPIVTDIPGNKELVIPEQSGLMVQAKNASALAKAIFYLYENADLRKTIGQQAKEYMRTDLNISVTIQKMKELYAKLAGSTTS